ncbi:hypothetical protein HYU96_00665 [Candidatus Daviesbacteria bacterium]|nr:hypothetical protein [Candidatus Daviesbacteria bacterium]
MVESPASLSARYASQMTDLKLPHFEEVDFPQSGNVRDVFDNFRLGFPERGGPRVLSLNFQGVSEIAQPTLEELAAAIQGLNVIRIGGRQIFTRAANICDPLSGNLSQFLGEINLAIAAVNGEEAVILGKESFVRGFSPAFLELSKLTGWVRGAIYLRDQLGISSPAARSKLLAMFQLGIVIARGDVGQNGVVHSLV